MFSVGCIITSHYSVSLYPFALQDRSSKGRVRETYTRSIKKDVISSELNEDGDAVANGGEG
jgi:hypothetical protein